LTDPLYLDFISYSQFYVAARELQEAIRLEGDDFISSTFEQKLGDSILSRLEFITTTDTQPRSDGESIPDAGTGSSNPDFDAAGASSSTVVDVSTSPSPSTNASPATNDPEAIVSAVQAWLDFLVKRGYCLKARAVLVNAIGDDENRGGRIQESFRMDVTTVGSATLWGTEAVLNDPEIQILSMGTSFDAYATKALLRSLGFRQSSVKLSAMDDRETLQQWTIERE